MIYRKLGPTGLKVSAISYGNWVNSDSKDAQKLTTDCVKTAWDQGVNFFDTAESYGYFVFIQDLARLKDNLEWLSKVSTYPDITLFSPLRSSLLQ